MSDDDKRLLERKPKFVEVDYLNLLPNPPTNTSSETRQELEQVKWKYNRPRPYQLAKKLGMDFKHFESPRKTHHTPSYPSGHSMYGHLVANILSDMYPDHEKEWTEAAKMVGDARVGQGVHFPSDNKASAYITKSIWDDVKDNYKTFF